MTKVAGKVAFVTGGGSGVALGQAKVLARAGAKVAIADLMDNRLEEAAKWFADNGLDVMTVKLDITDREAYAKAADAVEEQLGPVQLLFNTAGVSQFGPLAQATQADWDWQINVNLFGVINGVTTFLPRMLERGDDCHITTTASMSAFVGLPMTGIYATTKFAVRGYMETLEQELKDTKVKCSLLCPGAVNSNIHESVLTRPAHLEKTGYYGADEEVFKGLKQVIEIGMEPETLAEYTINAVEDDQFYILAYPEFKKTLEDLHVRVMSSLRKQEDDPEYDKRVAHGVPGGGE